MVASTDSYFVLPDLLSMCHLKGATNPHYEVAAAESSAWINSYNIFTDKKRAYFIQGSNELLVSHTYPYAGYEQVRHPLSHFYCSLSSLINQFRTCCDIVNLLFVVDEVSDEQNGADARATGEIFLQAMIDPDWDDGSKLARITKEYVLARCSLFGTRLIRSECVFSFRARYFRLAGPNTARRFLEHCKDYIDCVATEAELRERGEILDVESFIALRRENSAIRLCFGLFEYVLGIDLPDFIFRDPVFQEVYWAAADMVCWANVSDEIS
jgi:hypothetical protein